MKRSAITKNQGAESTLAFLVSLAEMQQMRNVLAAYQNPPPS